MSYTNEEVEELLRRNPGLKIVQNNRASEQVSSPLDPPKPSKYRNQRTEYNGVIYHSKKEATRAQSLDVELQAGIILFWCRQPEFVLPGGVIYKPDFITWDGEEIHVIEVKGIKTKEYIIKKKQVEALFKVKIEEW